VCGLYEAGTGDWMFRLPEWAEWINTQRRCLWVHGIPGSGKTVLISHLIEISMEQFHGSGKTAFAYYYCYFGHNQDEAAPALGSILNQLCRQSRTVSKTIHEMYRAGAEPKVVQLLKALEEILDNFDTIYIIIDALDESSPRETLLRVIRDMATDTRFRKIQLLASSREYFDIETVMGIISVPVSMSNPFVEEDIQRHVRSLMASNQKFNRFPRDLLEKIESAVTTGARGMYGVLVPLQPGVSLIFFQGFDGRYARLK